MFIEGSKFKKLREAMAGGDEMARKILMAYRDGADCSCDLENYFKPVEEETPQSEPEIEVAGETGPEMSKLERFLADNNISKGDDDYDEAVSDFYANFPNERGPISEVHIETEISNGNEFENVIASENETVRCYDNLILSVVNNVEISDTVRSGIIGKIQRIKDDKLEHIKTLQEIGKQINSKENKGDELL